MLTPELIAAIEAIVNRVLDEREAQKNEFDRVVAAQLRQQIKQLLDEDPVSSLVHFDQHLKNAARRQQERSISGKPESEL